LDECHPFKTERLKQDAVIWLGTPHQLSKLDCQTTEAMFLGVMLDTTLTFAPHIRRVCGKSFYYLRQLKIVQRSLSEAAAKTMVGYTPSPPAGLIIATVSCTVSAQFIFGHYKMYSIRRRVSYCASKRLITSLLTFSVAATATRSYSRSAAQSNLVISYFHSFIHICLIEKVVRTQLNIRIQHKTSIR